MTGTTENSITAVPRADLRRARRALLLVGIAGPAAITAIAVVLIASWLPELPDPAATHWGLHGVDGFGSPALYLWLGICIGFALPVLIVLSTLAMARGQWGASARLLGALALGLSGLSAVMNGGSVAIQRGLEDASQVGGIGGIVVLGFVVLVVLGAIGWIVQPHVRPTPAAPLQPVHLAAISSGERVVWMATATMPRAAMIGIGAIAALVLGIAVVMFVQAPEIAWIPAVVVLVIGVAFASTTVFRVKAGPDGLMIRSQVGVPRTLVPIDEIDSVRAVECNPFGEFGGFGWRLGIDGRTGIVLRRGPAIEVERRDKRPLVVTVDGAEVGAAVLQAYLDRVAEAPASGDGEGGTS